MNKKNFFTIIILSLFINACGELNQEMTTSKSLGKSSQAQNQEVLCAAVMVPMFNPNTNVCAEAMSSCESGELAQEGFIKLSIADYCNLGCKSDSCRFID